MWLRLACSSSSSSSRSYSGPKYSPTSPCSEIKYRKHTLNTRGGIFPQKSSEQTCLCLTNLTLSTASQCVHWYWKLLIEPWVPVIKSWSKATWLLLSLIRRDRQRAWHLHCLIKRLNSLAFFLCRKWAVHPTGYRAWHWDETRWFMIAFNLKWAIPDRCCAILFCMLKKKDLLFTLLGKVMVFISTKWLFALAFLNSQPIFKKQALRHRTSHSMTDPHKSTLSCKSHVHI